MTHSSTAKVTTCPYFWVLHVLYGWPLTKIALLPDSNNIDAFNLGVYKNEALPSSLSDGLVSVVESVDLLVEEVDVVPVGTALLDILCKVSHLKI